MTCGELNEFLADYRSGTLPPEVRRRFEEHLLGCPACVAYVRSYDATVRLVQATGHGVDQLLPPDAPEELVDAILEATVRAGRPPRPRS
jgi:anti-sigma factor RsiW